MNGRFIYFSFASLLGVLSILQSFFLFFLLFLIYLLVLFKFKRFSILQVAITIGIFFIFLVSSQLTVYKNKSVLSPTNSVFYLEYIQDPSIDGDLLQVIARDVKSQEKLLLRYNINSETEKKALETQKFYGSLCKVTGTLKKPQQAKNENAFNYREYLERQHIFWVAESRTIPLQNCTPVTKSVFIQLKDVRYNGINYIKRQFPPEVAALSAALIYGDRSLMDADLLADYQKIGITHLLAISGLHVSLLITMAFYIGMRLGGTREFMINLMLIILPVYAILTGGAPSVVRAVLMIVLVMIIMKWTKVLKLLPIDAISIAFSVFLFIYPFILFDVGFQLSFAVSFAIILSAPFISKRYQNNFTRMLAGSIIAQLSSLPFMLYHFFGISLISPIANLIFIPLYSYIFLPAVYILLILQFITGTVPSLFMNSISFLIHLSMQLAHFFSQYSVGEFVPGRPGKFILLIYSIILLVIFVNWEKTFPKKRMRLIIWSVFLFSFQNGWNTLEPIGEVSMIDVSQGDSILIQFPFGRGNYLIDTGGTLQFNEKKWQKRAETFEVGKDVVVPFLKGKGITQIDKLILTHGDMDHIGGTFAIMKELKIKQILMPSVEEPSDQEKKIILNAKKKGIDIVHVSEGDQWKAGDSFFLILSPEKNFTGERNRGSIVILAKINRLYWFFGGDLPQDGEEEIINKYSGLSIDVLKVGHHGSKTSSSEMFLKRLKPKVALISVGEKNRFGHPHYEVLKDLREIHSAIYRTDRHGEISYRYYHEKGTFFTFLP